MIFLGLPLNQINAEEVANSSVHHKQDYLSKLILSLEYVSTPSLLLSVNFLISLRRAKRSGKESSLEKYFCFLLIYIQ